MGKKITIDSATMVNKVRSNRSPSFVSNALREIKTILHPESIIHSMVEYNDSSVIAQMSYPNMMLPIQYALTYPRHIENENLKKLNLSSIKNLTFQEMDFSRFPMLELAYRVGKSGGLLPTVYNAANEAAVDLFIRKKIRFLDIEKIIFEMVEKYQDIMNDNHR